MILAGDIGGTKSNLALFPVEKGAMSPLLEHTLPSSDYPGLEELVREFLDHAKGRELLTTIDQIAVACFGVAGPVVDDRCETPNLPWIASAQGLKQALGLRLAKLINDLEATGYGVPELKGEEIVTLNEGSIRQTGNAALIAAGTGLGEAILYWDGEEFIPIASEGGHADFAPRNAVEMELLHYLLDRHDRISYERVLSGPGLFNIYSFLRDSGYGEEPAWLTEKFEQGDPSAAIGQAALANQSELCVKALDLFVSIYGAEAGNLALKFLAVSGVYVGGGIAPKINEKLGDGTFMKAFTHKGRLSSLLEAIPVRVILDPKTALYGAARCANLLLR
ncbi:MAG: glucokinase [Candidatus Methylomirabilales bacterium]